MSSEALPPSHHTQAWFTGTLSEYFPVGNKAPYCIHKLAIRGISSQKSAHGRLSVYTFIHERVLTRLRWVMNKHCAYQDPVDFAVTTLIASEHRNSMPLNLSPCVPAELTAKLGQGSQYISYTINISTLGSIFFPRTGKPGHIWILPEVRRRLGSRSLLKPHPLT